MYMLTTKQIKLCTNSMEQSFFLTMHDYKGVNWVFMPIILHNVQFLNPLWESIQHAVGSSQVW